MRAWSGFGRGIAFALLAASFCPLWLAVALPALGWATAFKVYLIAAAALYLLGSAPRRETGMAAAALIGACGALLLCSGAAIHTTALALAAGLGALRSGLLWTSATAAPRFAVEFALIAAGLLAAARLGAGAVLPEAFALWGFFLVQSAFFLIPGVAAAQVRRAGVACDAFEDTTRRLRAVLAERS